MSLMPMCAGKNTLEKSHLKHAGQHGSTKFYGFGADGDKIVVALQESDWYLAFFKPFYRRILIFENFKAGNAEERLADFFASVPTMNKLKKSMHKRLELRDVNRYIDDFKEYYL